eukprot:g6017.t1
MPRRMRSRKDVIADLGSRPVTAISLQDLFKYSRVDTPEWQVVANGNYMRRELPVRFAQRALELDALPGSLPDSPQVRLIRDLYSSIAEELVEEPKLRTVRDVDRFARKLEGIMRRKDASHVVQTISMGVLELRRDYKARGVWHRGVRHAVDRHLDRFHMARIGLRFITEQFITSLEQRRLQGRRQFSRGGEYGGEQGGGGGAIYGRRRYGSGNVVTGNDDVSGVIDSKCNPFRVAQAAAEDARILCLHGHQRFQQDEFDDDDDDDHDAFGGDGGGDDDDDEGHLSLLGSRSSAAASSSSSSSSPFMPPEPPEVVVKGDPNATFTFIPSHLHYMLLELLKNAMRATVDFHGGDGGPPPTAKMPPVTVVVAHGTEDVTIRISDEGGGIKRSQIDLLWTYMHSTAPWPEAQENGLSNSMALHQYLSAGDGAGHAAKKR